MPDIRSTDKRRRGATTAFRLTQETVGRPISRAQALRVARGILARAERERLEAADVEAARGIQWEDIG